MRQRPLRVERRRSGEGQSRTDPCTAWISASCLAMPSPKPKDSNTLALAGDGDDEDIVLALERAFSVELGPDASRCETVGDLYEAILHQVAASDTPGKCASSMAFYRVRAALSADSGCGDCHHAGHAAQRGHADLGEATMSKAGGRAGWEDQRLQPVVAWRLRPGRHSGRSRGAMVPGALAELRYDPAGRRHGLV